MPKLRATIALDLHYSGEAMRRIRKGLLPRSMDDRWFLCFEKRILYMHRSWTGHAIYQVRFKVEPDGWRAIAAVTNRDAEQYGGTDDEEDRRCVRGLINELLLTRSAGGP